jgi:hypothetical protein
MLFLLEALFIKQGFQRRDERIYCSVIFFRDEGGG